MIKTTKWMLAGLLTVGLSTGLVACRDEYDKDGIPDNEAEYEEAGRGWDIITQLTSERKAPEGWLNMTFEPTIGKASEADPYTRVVATNNVAAAAERFGGLIGLTTPFDETTPTYTYTHDGMGTLTYQAGSESGEYMAQVTVNLRQVPHLKKILYRSPEQTGNNGDFAGTAWYRFGDVVKDRDGYYWICVRPAFGKEGKEDSHWMCLSHNLPDANIETYKTSTGIQNYLPTALGKSTEHMQNAAEMFHAMLYPDKWLQALVGKTTPKMFNDFSTKNIEYHNIYFWQLVCNAWEQQGLFEEVLGVAKAAMLSDSDWRFLYSGYSWWWKTDWKCYLYEATYRAGGTGKKANRHDVTYTKPVKDMHNVTLDARSGGPVGVVSGDFFDDDHKLRWYARYKKGHELGGGAYDVKTAISGCTDVYVYNTYYGRDVNDDPEVTTEEMVKDALGIDRTYTGDPYYRLGDVLEDEDGARWFCVQNAGVSEDFRESYLEEGKDEMLKLGFRVPASSYAWFISLTPYDKSGSSLFTGTANHYTNLPTLDQARYISHILGLILFKGIWSYSGHGEGLDYTYEHIKTYAKVDLTKLVVRRDSLFDDQLDKNHTLNEFVNVAYSDKLHASQRKQAYLRYIFDCCAVEYDKDQNPVPGSRMNQIWQQTAYTAGNYQTTMFLQDLTDASLVTRYAYDEWVTLPWYTKGNEGDEKPYHQIYPYEKIRNRGYEAASPNLFLWDEKAMDFFQPVLTSMYNEPVMICRVMKVKDRGEKATRTVDGKRIVREQLCDYGGLRNQENFKSRGTLDVMTGLFTDNYRCYFNGQRTSVLKIPFLGEE